MKEGEGSSIRDMRAEIWHRWLNGEEPEAIAEALDIPPEVAQRVIAKARTERGDTQQ